MIIISNLQMRKLRERYASLPMKQQSSDLSLFFIIELEYLFKSRWNLVRSTLEYNDSMVKEQWVGNEDKKVAQS